METAYIGMGANLPSRAGEPAATLAAAAVRLERLGRVARRSRLYSTAPVGFHEQPRFVNAVIALETELEPRALLTALLEVEREFGRERAKERANGPRTLDLDILIYGERRIDEEDLQVPHPRLAERAFVLVPLSEIAAGAVDARSGRAVGELLQRLFPGSEDENVAVVPMASAGWRPGCGGDDGVRADGAGTSDSSTDAAAGTDAAGTDA
jgi:2-amino-4-hydroxy-6-hydroxymethyldihydropteridine diphosphokinase